MMADSDVKSVDIKSSTVTVPHAATVPSAFHEDQYDPVACTVRYDEQKFRALDFKDKVHSLRLGLSPYDSWVPEEYAIAESMAEAVVMTLGYDYETYTFQHYAHLISILRDELRRVSDASVSVAYRACLAHVLPQRNNRVVQYPVGKAKATAGLQKMRDALLPFMPNVLVDLAWEYAPDLPIHRPPISAAFADSGYGENSLFSSVSWAPGLYNRHSNIPFMAYYIADAITGFTSEHGNELTVRQFWYGVSAQRAHVEYPALVETITVVGEFSHEQDKARLFICPACLRCTYCEFDDVFVSSHHPWCPGMGGVAYGPGVMSPYFEVPSLAWVNLVLSYKFGGESTITVSPLIEFDS